MRLRLAALLLIVALPLAAQAPAPVAFSFGLRDSLVSQVLGEERKVLVYLPPGYTRGETRYPVIYLLDGDGHFLHTTGIISFLSDVGRMPPAILVAIPNTDRTRDFTPPTSTDSLGEMPTAGGAENFLRFFERELFPHIERRYRTAPFRVLVGHSLGGLLAVEALQARPELFGGYVIISPSLWWDGMAHSKRAATELRRRPGLRAMVYMTAANEGGQMLAGAQELAEAFRTAGPPGLRWRFVHDPEEDHGSIPHRSTYDGLEFIFAEMFPGQARTVALLAEGLPAVDRFYRQASSLYGYELATPEWIINRLGYFLLGRQRMAEGIAAFLENTRRFPRSANTYDSLGDGYLAAGDLPQAIAAYRTAVEVGIRNGDPVITVSARKLREAERRQAAGGP